MWKSKVDSARTYNYRGGMDFIWIVKNTKLFQLLLLLVVIYSFSLDESYPSFYVIHWRK